MRWSTALLITIPTAALFCASCNPPTSSAQASATVAPAPTNLGPGVHRIVNDTYAGWSVDPQEGFAGLVSAYWTVPAVSCGDAIPATRPFNQSRAAVWVGTWGPPKDGNAWLPQVGTASICAAGGARIRYVAVVQMFHARGQPPTTLSIKVAPGDRVYAKIEYVTYDSAGRQQYRYQFKNLSRGGSASGSLQTGPGVMYPNANWEGGVIVELESDAGSLLNPPRIGGLAKFSTIRITGAEVDGTPLDKFPGACSQSSGPCDLYYWDLRSGDLSKRLATVSLRGGDGSFTVTWDAYH